MSIKILDKNTISKIAAGEVIENPASVVKELIENSIDANAKNIKIEIEGGGTELIKVIDDGDGIEKDDLELAFTEHATSKLKKIEDLDFITSFGFRGEALSSIAVISNVSITTKRKIDNSSFGYKYVVNEFYNNHDIIEVASNNGTIIEVRNLFYNVPVRKKFLKGNIKENGLILDTVIKIAIARPDIAFSLTIDGKVRFNSRGDNSLKNILFSLYGREIVDNLIIIDDCINDVIVKGFIAKPIIARNTRNDEIYYINDRFIKSKTICNAIENAYEEFLMQHKFPLVVLKINIDGKKVDVNVHPKKMEVRFSDDYYIYYAVYNAIHKKLKSLELIHEENIDDSKNIKIDNNTNDYRFDLDVENDNTNDYHSKQYDEKGIDINTTTYEPINVDDLPTLKDKINNNLDKKINSGFNLSYFYDNLEGNSKKDERYSETSFIKTSLSDDHKYIGQIFETYILVEYEDKLYIIDQHAAHEKINFEKIMDSYKKGEMLSQKIFPSIVLKLTPIEYAAVVNNIDSFYKIGYEISTFGDSDIKVDAVPFNIFNIGNEKLLMDIIDSFADEKNKEHYDSIVEKIASISCKKSIKANYILSKEEVKQILRDLFKLDNPYNCPHGRPTIISLSKQEFEKKFGRIV